MQRILERYRIRGDDILFDSQSPTANGSSLDSETLKDAHVIVMFCGKNITYDTGVSLYDYYSYCQREQKLCIPLMLSKSNEEVPNELVKFGALRITIDNSNYSEVDALKKAHELTDRYFRLKTAQRQNSEEVKQNIAHETPEFIKEAKKRLINRAKIFTLTASGYFVFGLIVASLGIFAGYKVYINDKEYLGTDPKLLLIVFFFIKSVVILSLCIAITQYCFSLGKAYMHEALKIEDRIHAISFGEYYVNVYKDSLTSDDIKEVFRNWNISIGNTAFLNQKNDEIDPKLIDKGLNVVAKAKNILHGEQSDKL